MQYNEAGERVPTFQAGPEADPNNEQLPRLYILQQNNRRYDALPTGPRFWYYVGTPREDVPVCEVDIQTKHTPRPDFTPDNGPEPAHKPSSHSNEQSSPASTRPPTPPSKVPKPRRGWEHVEDGPHEQTKKHQDHELEAANKLGDEMADEDLALQRAEEEDLQMQKAQGDHHEEDLQEKLDSEKQERSDAARQLQTRARRLNAQREYEAQSENEFVTHCAFALNFLYHFKDRGFPMQRLVSYIEKNKDKKSMQDLRFAMREWHKLLTSFQHSFGDITTWNINVDSIGHENVGAVLALCSQLLPMATAISNYRVDAFPMQIYPDIMRAPRRNNDSQTDPVEFKEHGNIRLPVVANLVSGSLDLPYIRFLFDFWSPW